MVKKAFFHESLTSDFQLKFKDSTLCSHTVGCFTFFFLYCCFHKKSSNLQRVNTSAVTMLQGRCCVVVLLLLFCVEYVINLPLMNHFNYFYFLRASCCFVRPNISLHLVYKLTKSLPNYPIALIFFCFQMCYG